MQDDGSKTTAATNGAAAPKPPEGSIGRDIVASIVVFLVALPLCMGIAVASGAPVSAGLLTGMIGGALVGPISGSPLQVSGPAAGLTVPIFEAIEAHGLPSLGIIVLLAGAIQLVAGICRLGQWFRAVSPAVIHGMLAGIGVLIFASQFHVMVDDKPRQNGLQNLMTIPEAVAKGLPLPEWVGTETRRTRLDFLKQVGDLHELQSELQLRVANVVSIRGSDQQHKLQAEFLHDHVRDQETIIRRTEELLSRAESIRLKSTTTDGDLRASLTKSIAIQQTALSDLNAGRYENAEISQAESAGSLSDVLGDLKNHQWAAKIGLLTIGIIIAWQLLAPKKLKFIPGPLIAIAVVTAASAVLVLPVLYVELPAQFTDGINFVSLSTLEDVSFWKLLQTALVVAVIASAETLLCATAVDQMHNGPRTKYDRELAAQGIGNMLCGMIGALPMTGVIVRSATNVQAGATTRLSTTLHGVWLVLFVVALGSVLRMIPTSALAGILVYTGYKLINPKELLHLWRVGKTEALIFLIVVATIVIEDLLIGVLVGVGLSTLKLLWVFSHLKTKLEISQNGKRAQLSLEGAATFLRLPQLAAKLEDVPAGAHLHVDLQQLDYIDHACMTLLMNWAKQHESTGGLLIVDWGSLHARFSHRKRNGNGSELTPSEPLQDQKNKKEPVSVA
jgi:MFS superfamily sulfate permease-like transporter